MRPAVRRSIVLVVALETAAMGLPALAAPEYQDILGAAGIDFELAGAIDADGVDRDWPAFPEIMGGGACFADFDGDGYDDLYLVNQRFNPLNPLVATWPQVPHPRNKLYVNDASGGFLDRSAGSGVDSEAFGYGCSSADADGDDDVDLFVANFGDNEFFLNNGDATFTNASAESGLAMTGACGDYRCMSMSSAWADYDLDGDLDLYVANYVETTLVDGRRGPGQHLAQVNFLHRNNGDGTFAEVAEAAGVAGNPTDLEGGKTLGVVWFDYDLDRDLDLFAANDQTRDDFYENQGNGVFVERDEAGIADPRAGMGVATGDYDNDGYPDLYITHYAAQHNGFYRNRGDRTFEDRSGEDDLANDWANIGWGTAFTDLDRDMDLDIVVVNGHTEEHFANSGQPTRLFRNDPEPAPGALPGDRLWVEITSSSGPGVAEEYISRGAAFGDYDLDGDVDMAIVNNFNQTAQFLQATGVTNHHLTIRLQQPGLNRFAVGARVLVEAGGVTQAREVQAGSSYLSQNTLQLEFGLGAETMAETVTVQWPNGGTTVLEGVFPDQVVRIDRATGTAIADVLSPLTQATLSGLAGDNGWFRSPVTATIVTADRGTPVVSGVTATEHSTDGGPWSPLAGPVTVSNEGLHVLRARSADAAGNQEPPRLVPIKVDTSFPTFSHALAGELGSAGWWISPVIVSLAAADAVSGVALTEYAVDDGGWQDYQGPFPLAQSGVRSVQYRATDVAGNTGEPAVFQVRIDTEAPDADIRSPAKGSIRAGDIELAATGFGPALIIAETPPGAPWTTLVEVVAAAVDASSGVDHVVFVLDGTAQSIDDEGPEYRWTWDVGGAGAGPHRLEVRAADAAGNVASRALDVLILGGGLPRGAESAGVDGGPP